MALWECLVCTTAYAVGLTACPHCGSGAYREAGTAVDLTALSKKELLAEATRRGVDVPSKATKAEIRGLLE